MKEGQIRSLVVEGNQGQLATPLCVLFGIPRSKNFAPIFKLAKVGRLGMISGNGISATTSKADWLEALRGGFGICPDQVERTVTVKYDSGNAAAVEAIRAFSKMVTINGATILSGDQFTDADDDDEDDLPPPAREKILKKENGRKLKDAIAALKKAARDDNAARAAAGDHE